MRLFPLLVVSALLVLGCNKSEGEGQAQTTTEGQPATAGGEQNQGDKTEPAADGDKASDSDQASDEGKDDGDQATDEGKDDGDQATDEHKDGDSDESTGESSGGGDGSGSGGGDGSGSGGGNGSGGGQGKANQGPPKDLQVLPKSWDRKKVVKVMKEYNRSLGVECEFCHDKTDYAANGNKHKKISREMVKMQNRVNKEFFGGKEEVGCYTCHQGKVHPAK
jgi:hypothetical protein